MLTLITSLLSKKEKIVTIKGKDFKPYYSKELLQKETARVAKEISRDFD